jgi:hypothetical protein
MAQQDSATQSATLTTDRVDRYTPDQKAAWDEFVRNSKNGTFLFLRDYMDHMQDRIQDCSLMIRDGGGRLSAVLPGYIEEDNYFSHGRLTYAGLVTGMGTRLSAVLTALDSAATWLVQAGVRTMWYKPVPYIYHRLPADEDRYALFLLGAQCVRSGMLAVVSLRDKPEYQERRRRAVRKAQQSGLTVRISNDYPEYWCILTELLRERYGAAPVHTVAEMEHLTTLFPNNIKLFACYSGPEMLAGIIVYTSARVMRAQYIASSAAGRKAGALDLVIDHLIREAAAGVDYIDLGTSDEQSGRVLNVGLMDQKEGFGARSVALEQYRVDLTSWQPGTLTSVLR